LGGEVFQVATGQEIHIIYLVSLMNEITKDILGKEVKIEFTEKRKGDIVRNYSDVSKIKEILKWTPKYSLEEGITKTIEWFKENNHE
jgi:nucleoside-diphosphate-sugar epimerase